MAIMLPEIPKHFKSASLEGVIYERLSSLSDDHYIFHSFSILEIKPNKNYDWEIDFVIFHPGKGIIVLEAKAGQVMYRDGGWRYQTGKLMNRGGPFNQAKENKYKIIQLIDNLGDPQGILDKCAFFHAVCFPSVKRGHLLNLSLPAEAPVELIIADEDLMDIETSINRIYRYNPKRTSRTHTPLKKSEIKFVLNNVLSPSFDLIPDVNIRIRHNKTKFNKMLDEQKVIFDFLNYQRTATISGAAGTGKTMLAIEKARRLGEAGHKVLFLCYNRDLRDHLHASHRHKSIKFYTLDAFTLVMTGSLDSTYRTLEEKLEMIYVDNLPFEFQHVIIDEGQDFGQRRIEEQKIIEILDVLMKDRKGIFYVFYDRNQLVQGDAIPKYIDSSECRVTLYKNCRNTLSIAQTSMKPINKEPIVFDGAIEGNRPSLTLVRNEDSFYKALDDTILSFLNSGYSDVVILSTCASNRSMLSSKCGEGFYRLNNKKIRWTTCRKFKGLESDAVILIDITERTFLDEFLLFYVGASRAKFELSIIAQMDESAAKSVLSSLSPNSIDLPAQKGLATLLNAVEKSHA